MRDWNNKLPQLQNRLTNWFESYLWGIETTGLSASDVLSTLVWILPMRDWNHQQAGEDWASGWVWILPMRDWNSDQIKEGNSRNDVWILPMRDWNSDGCPRHRQSDRVWILPMRDWNKAPRRRFGTGLRFESYLWGIETLQNGKSNIYFPTVWILPMRDWNS